MKTTMFSTSIAPKMGIICLILWILPNIIIGQEILITDSLNLSSFGTGRHHIKLKLFESGMSDPITIPIILIKGKEQGPVLGLTAGIHGNELNGIGVIHQLTDAIDPLEFNGTLIAVPGLNSISIPMHQRRFFDHEDLNRQFPGKPDGHRSQQFAWQINQKLLKHFDYLIDMHTASFGRENSFYVRGDFSDQTIERMAIWQGADILLNSKGPSTGTGATGKRTLRAEAMSKGIPTITVEYGNPQVYQPDLIQRGVQGMIATLAGLRMIDVSVQITHPSERCSSSYWIYTQEGGYLEVLVHLKQKVSKGERIAVIKDPFGKLIKEYHAPEDGIVIGKSSNPINMSGGRIIHLGILE